MNESSGACRLEESGCVGPPEEEDGSTKQHDLDEGQNHRRESTSGKQRQQRHEQEDRGQDREHNASPVEALLDQNCEQHAKTDRDDESEDDPDHCRGLERVAAQFVASLGVQIIDDIAEGQEANQRADD